MTLGESVRLLRRRWYVVLLCTALGIAAALAFTLTRTPTYAATAQLFVSTTSRDADAASLQSSSTFTQARVKSYADIVTNSEVLRTVISEVGLSDSERELADRITVNNPLDTVLLDVTVTDSDPARAATTANAIAIAFPTYVADLETPAGGTKSPVRVARSNSAVTPTDPISPVLPLNVGLGLILGLALGIGLVVIRAQLNTSIMSIEDSEREAGVSPLGVLPFDRAAVRRPLIQAGDTSGRAEALRTLRTNLQFTNIDNPPRVIVVTSPLPGEGKSMISSNIALTLAMSGATAVLVEGDLRKPSLGNYLRVSSAAGLTSVLAGRHELGDVLVPHRVDGLTVLLSGPKPPNPSELLGSVQMARLLATLTQRFDYVVIDAPPLLPVTDAAVLAAVADGAVLVMRYGKTSRDHVAQAIRSLKAVDARLLGTVLNFVPRRKLTGASGYGYGYGTRAITDIYGRRSAGESTTTGGPAPRQPALNGSGIATPPGPILDYATRTGELPLPEASPDPVDDPFPRHAN
jgi:capsular exopolysaccharide synthesis family protein